MRGRGNEGIRVTCPGETGQLRRTLGLGYDASMLRVGVDLVQISRIAGSIDTFGARFVDRVFTPSEAAYATTPERLAARFAAKEAVKKALELDGVSWRDIEVTRRASGACDVVLHGAARAAADAIGARELALSMSHEGDYATAMVVAACEYAT
jgi:holo-[acyl-carrier protein] synthase